MRRAGVLAAAALPLAACAPARAAIRTHPYTFGQAPVFLRDGSVLFGKDFRDGNGTQVYRTALDGSGRRCLTCDMPAPNNVPAPRPQGDWVLSTRGTATQGGFAPLRPASPA